VLAVAPVLSYCVVNTNGREDLLACLDAVERTHPDGVEAEILVLDNASDDGSAEAVRRWMRGAGEKDGGGWAGARGAVRLIALEQRAGKAANDSRLLEEAEGRYCLLLNEDSELRGGAVSALIEALDGDRLAGAAGAQLLDSEGNPVACAWRFPGVGTALVGALFLHRWLTVQSGSGKGGSTGSTGWAAAQGEPGRGTGTATPARRVDWAQSSALLVRRGAAAEVGYLDPDFFVYYDECDFCKRLAEIGWHTLYVPAAEAVHHDQLSTDLAAGLPRIVEFHRNRDLYMRKHHGRTAALAVRLLTAWAYAVRALAALVLPNQPARIYLAHAGQALLPNRGKGIRELA
jgi:N-acetylglucosaminyl-diphospho-decaprenol L-rhamnosyltransferase